MIYGIKGAVDLSADLIIEKGNDTYVCVFDPTKVDRSAGALPIEQQPIWQITCYRQTTIVDGEDEINRTQALYPKGSNAYAFAPSDIDNLGFSYRL